MMDMGYSLHLIDMLAKLYRKQLAKVKVAGTLSEWFPVKKGIRQGCVRSPYLFNILAEMVMSRAAANEVISYSSTHPEVLKFKLSITKTGLVDWLVSVSGAPKAQGLDQA